MGCGTEVLVVGGAAEEVAGVGACLRALDVTFRHVRQLPERAAPQPPARLVVWWMNTARALEVARDLWPGVPRLGVLESAVVEAGEADGLLDGLDDFVVRPLRPNELARRVLRLLRPAPMAGELVPGGPHLIGTSPSFLRVVARMALFAASDANVLVAGETGTGKELLARAVHYRSARAGAPFVPVNCGALPDALFENELFGHARGAYTDARDEQRGLLEEAEGGTLLLDEVDSLTPAAQVKLLRFLQEREFRRLGSARSRRADVRVIAATNAELSARVREGAFREDLYYRLNVLPLRLPPLRERADDLELLAGHFLERMASHGAGAPWRLSPAALRLMRAHSWPGNVRELEVVLQRSVVLLGASSRPGCALEPEDLVIDDQPGTGPTSPAEELEDLSLEQAKDLVLCRFERRYLAEVLGRSGGNVSHAARRAGKDRRSFQRLLQKHALDRDTFRGHGAD